MEKVSPFYYELLKIAGKEEGFEPRTEAEEREETIQGLENQLSQFVTPDGKPITEDPKQMAIDLLNGKTKF